MCLEPSDNKLQLGATGSLHAEVTFVGRTAHSARPWQGENAIHKAGTFLTELGGAARRATSCSTASLYRTVTSVTLAQGGRGRNIIPDRFQLNVNHRFAPDTSLEQAEREVERARRRARAEVRFTDRSPSAPPFAEHPLVVALRESGVAARRAEAGVDRRRALRRARRSRGQLRPRRAGAGPPANEWTSLSKLEIGRRHPRALAHARSGGG